MTNETIPESLRVFFHSKTEAEMMRAGRIVPNDRGPGYKFSREEAQYPGLFVGVNDDLEPGKAYCQISPPPISDGEIEIERNEFRFGKNVVAAFAQKEKIGFAFDDTGQSDEEVRSHFRAMRDKRQTRYEPWST